MIKDSDDLTSKSSVHSLGVEVYSLAHNLSDYLKTERQFPLCMDMCGMGRL